MTLNYRKLTRAAAKALKSGGKIAEHGITVERTTKGDLIYRVAAMVDGRRIHRTVGRESQGFTRTDAEQKRDELRVQERAGELNLPEGRKTHVSFAIAAKEYLTRIGAMGGKDTANKRRHIEQNLVPYFGTARANGISTLAVAEYNQHRLALNVKQATVNRELATLSHILNRLVEWKVINPNEKPKIVKGDEQRKAITVLTDKESDALIQAASGDSDPHLQLFVAFGLNAAMRHSEIVAARYDQVDFESRRIFIPMAKAGEREQPITPTLTAMLRARRQQEPNPDGWIFPAKLSAKTAEARASHRPSMEYGFKRAVVRAGLDPRRITPHVMRHTAITRLVKAGVDLPTIQRISGHKTLAMVMRYVHIHGRHIDRAIAALDSSPRRITQELHTV